MSAGPRLVASGATPGAPTDVMEPSAGASAAADGDHVGNQEIVKLARGGSLNFAGAIVNQVASMGLTVLLTQALGRNDFGLYAQAQGLIAILQILALCGMGTSLTRFVAVHVAENDRAALRGTIRFGMFLSFAFALVLGLVIWWFAGPIATGVFRSADMELPLQYVGMSLPLAVVMPAAISVCQGFRTMRPYAMVTMVLDPVGRLLITAIAVGLGLGLEGSLAAMQISFAVSSAVGLAWMLRMLGPAPALVTYPVRRVLKFSNWAWVATFSTQGLLWADSILLKLFKVDNKDIAVYNVASRLVLMAAFVMMPINIALSPRIADLTTRKLYQPLRRAYAAAAGWMLRFSFPLFIALVLFAADLLDLFGKGYASGAFVTVALAGGKLTDVATGPCGLMLNMAGRNKISVLNNFGALLLNIGLDVVLIPAYGIKGAAIGWGIALLVVNIARMLEVRALVVPVLPFGSGTVRALFAAGAAFVAGLVVRLVAEGMVALVAGGLVVAVVYTAAVLASGLPAEDRMVFNDIKAKTFARR